ncbi:MAG: hypothetical protein ACRDRK_05995 [Pseudonocardia sp.]
MAAPRCHVPAHPGELGVLAALPDAAQRYLEGLVATGTYEYQSDFARRYFSRGKAEGEAKGKAEGEAKAVLAVLDARGIDVPARARIAECSDIDQLDTWERRAVTVDSVHDLFAWSGVAEVLRGVRSGGARVETVRGAGGRTVSSA